LIQPRLLLLLLLLPRLLAYSFETTSSMPAAVVTDMWLQHKQAWQGPAAQHSADSHPGSKMGAPLAFGPVDLLVLQVGLLQLLVALV
jgi:hypothetical protein